MDEVFRGRLQRVGVFVRVGLESEEEGFAVEGSEAGAGVPAGVGFVDAVVAAGDGVEGLGLGDGGEVDGVLAFA